MHGRVTMARWSKAPRGLFVLPQVARICTGTAISPGPQRRQCSTRYAIRAGRNLPDKEFRYLRTIIVIAAVHQGFGSERKPLPLTFWHRAGVSPHTVSCDFAETCVFGKQSVEPVPCDHPGASSREGLHTKWCPFFRRYGANLPSSFAEGLPFTSGHSSQPTCVGLRYGHQKFSLAAFLAGMARCSLPLAEAADSASPLTSTVRTVSREGLHSPTRHRLTRTSHRFASRYLPGPRVGNNDLLVARDYQPVVHRLPWHYTRLGLGPANPEWMDRPQEPLGFRCDRFARSMRYSCRHSHFHALQQSSRSTFNARGTLPYRAVKTAPAASGEGLAPLHCRRQGTRPVSYYALFQGWLLLSQPPGCL